MDTSKTFDEGTEAMFGGTNYFISASWMARSFSDARTYCQYHGADLALITSDDINTFLHDMNSRSGTCLFFGLTDQANEGTFTWIDGTPLRYSKWAAGEPNNAGNEDCTCLDFYSKMRWNDIPCFFKGSFICERQKYTPENEWTLLNGTLYYISQSSMTSYSFARRFCQAKGGDLAQPRTQAINTHLIDLAKGTSFWFGLDDLNQDGTFQWIDGTPLDGNEYPAWSNTDATLWMNKSCVHQQGHNGWRKRPCTSYLRFACEKPPNRRPIPPVHLMAATGSTYHGGLLDASFLCLLGSEDEDILSKSARRLVRLTEAIQSDTYTVPGTSNNLSSVETRHTLPATMQGFGFFECAAVTATRMTSASLAIILSTRYFQPSDGRFTKTIRVGDNITLSVMNTSSYTGSIDDIRWKKFNDDGWVGHTINPSSVSHTIQSATLSDASVYVTHETGRLEQLFSFIRLIVKECPDSRWNPPLCDRLCDTCYNGGICHELSGTCICAPGFAGKNCLQACSEHRFGWDCEFQCGSGHALDQCAGSQICLPDPYGCNCLAGYTGIYCNESCPDGMFGADCLQECHCAAGADCDDFTGDCPGDCLTGWSGPACRVPSVCPIGYFGTTCTQKCNCMNGTACEKDSGFCVEVEGQCDLGYVSDSVEFPSHCNTFSGCYSSCSKTCHCSGGVDDCSFLTGDCLSSTCHPRWMGDQCQIDRFQTSSAKTNPGIALFSCAFTASSRQALSPDYVKAAVGNFSPERQIPQSSTQYIDRTLNNLFLHISAGQEEPIYCFVGDPEITSEFAFVRLPTRDFFVLPIFKGKSELLDSGTDHAAIAWRQWDPDIDTGDRPIVGYKVYVQSGGSVVLTQEVQPPSTLNTPISKRSTVNVTAMVMYNITGLQAGTTYAIQIAAIRDGINGEGEQGPALTFTTERPIPSTECGGPSSSIAPVVGGAVGAVAVIMAIILIVVVVKKRRSDQPKTEAASKSKGKESDSSPQYENPVFDQSKPGSHTHLDLDAPIHSYLDVNTGSHADQDPNTVTANYQNVSDPHTYQDLKKHDEEANYEELRDATQMKRDYVNVQGI